MPRDVRVPKSFCIMSFLRLHTLTSGSRNFLVWEFHRAAVARTKLSKPTVRDVVLLGKRYNASDALKVSIVVLMCMSKCGMKSHHSCILLNVYRKG